MFSYSLFSLFCYFTIDIFYTFFQHVGCDLVVDSNAKEDICGVCQGDGSQCKTFQGLYTRQEGAGKPKQCVFFICKNYTMISICHYISTKVPMIIYEYVE